MFNKLFLSRAFAVLSVMMLILISSQASSAESKLEDFVRLPSHRDVQISPDGKYLSMIYKKDGSDLLVVMDLATRKPIQAFKPRGNNAGVGDVYWANKTRLVYKATESYAWDNMARDNGEIIAVNIDGSDHEVIFGSSIAEKSFTRLKQKEADEGYSEIIDLLKNDDSYILIAFYPWKKQANFLVPNENVNPTLYELNVYTGKKRKVGYLPIPLGTGITDNDGKVRFATGVSQNNSQLVYFKKSDEAEWQEFSLGSFDGKKVQPLSFTEDNKNVYLSANVGDGTRALYLFNLENNSIEKLFHDEKVDISIYIEDFAERRIVAVGTDLALPEYHYIDPEDKKAKLHKVLMDAFNGLDVFITSANADASKAVVFVQGDTNPGDYYLFGTKDLKADFLLSGRDWLDLDSLNAMQTMEFETRDGTKINGYLTLPKGGKTNLPLVVLPHGGPHGIRDFWGFDWESQLLSNFGYAVLQVNYRGSGGFGIEFEQAGYGKWGTLMQDDITDATQSVIKQGIVDPARICIYGASYGGYAALMGAVKTPDLFKCAIGSAGVYNLPMMFSEGDIPDSRSGLAYLKNVIGNDIADQKSRSPAYNVDKIKADILLIHGAKDERAPIEQAESLKDAFDKIGKHYDWLELSDEGHGYYDEANRLKVYQKVLAFLDKNIGKNTTKTAKN